MYYTAHTSLITRIANIQHRESGDFERENSSTTLKQGHVDVIFFFLCHKITLYIRIHKALFQSFWSHSVSMGIKRMRKVIVLKHFSSNFELFSSCNKLQFRMLYPHSCTSMRLLWVEFLLFPWCCLITSLFLKVGRFSEKLVVFPKSWSFLRKSWSFSENDQLLNKP